MWSSSEPSGPRRCPLWRRLAGRLRRGAARLRSVVSPGPLPPPDFDWRRYVDANADLAAAGITDETSAVRHWREHGSREGRQWAALAPPPPPGFDWRWYIRAYTDLAPAGITDEPAAIRHWREHGCREGRRGAPRRPNSFDWLAYVDRFEEQRDPLAGASAARALLVCPSIDSVFLRAWGDLVCWDDAGSDRVLQAWDSAADYAEVFVRGPFERIRRELEQGRMPWPDECARCLLLRLMPTDGGAPWDRTFVRMLRVEPSYHCTLDCPGCVPLAARYRHTRAFQLAPEILDKVVADFVAGGLAVDAVDFQGHGEPLLNPRLWEMVRNSRARLPHAWISVTTNAQGRFRPQMSDAGLDEIVCSIDGVDAETYECYRVHGRFDLAWRFLVDFARAGGAAGGAVRVVWKYVVFGHNSAPATLLRAQEMAREAGVAELVFVLTRNGPAARRVQTPEDVPRLASGPPLSFRFHEPAVEDLEARLARSRRLSLEGEREQSAALVESVRRNLERFYPPGAPMPERQGSLAARAAAPAPRS